MKINKTIVFCVETKGHPINIDRAYIEDIIDKYYLTNARISIKFICLDGKYNFNSTRVVKEIKEYKRLLKNNVEIVHCLDKDDFHVKKEAENFGAECQKYCENNGYELIWFVKNIEHVLHNKIVSKTNKRRALKSFTSKNKFNEINYSKLLVENFRSNEQYFIKLNKHFEKKNR